MSNAKRYWTDDRMKGAVMEVVNALGLDRMPSQTECRDYFHNSCLTNAVSKYKGWYSLATEMGLDIKESETQFGRLFEGRASDLLKSQGFQVRRMTTKYPYDLLVDDCIKVDVKASKLFHCDDGNYYAFNLDKEYSTCDFYLLLTVDDDNTINRRMIVPSNQVICNSKISVGETKSKYHKFSDRFDLLETASAFWTDLVKGVTT